MKRNLTASCLLGGLGAATLVAAPYESEPPRIVSQWDSDIHDIALPSVGGPAGTNGCTYDNFAGAGGFPA